MRTLPYLLLALFLYGCIDEYIPKGVESLSRLLVMEGNITDGESVIRLSRSIGLDVSAKGTTIDHASVFVEKDNGERLEGVLREKGTYVISTGSLEADRKYRLHITIDGEVYCSEYLSPIFTVEIDSITSVKDTIGDPVRIHLYTHDPDDRSKYYMWSYKEIWEVKAELFANYGLWEGEFVPFDMYTGINTYYCWVRDSSKGLIMASSENLSENVIDRKEIAKIYSADQRLSEYYCIEVSQNQVRKETYDYYANMQKNVEQTGDLFSSIPSELKGNIRCISNPDLPVIGFCEVTKTTWKRFYIDLYDGYYEPFMQYCQDSIIPPLGSLNPALPPDFPYFPNSVYGWHTFLCSEKGDTTLKRFAPYGCVDCRLMRGATKDRPDFWPSEHY